MLLGYVRLCYKLGVGATPDRRVLKKNAGKGIESMKLEKFLTQEESAILDKWFDRIVESYPQQTINLLKREQNQFANPVGHNLKAGIHGLYKALTGELDPDKVHSLLDQVVRIRAVQDFTPAQAVGFVFLLKEIFRETRGKEQWKDLISPDDLLALDSRIDEIALLAFNVYVACREKLYEVRIKEVKNRSFRLLQRANLLAEIPSEEPGIGDSIT